MKREIIKINDPQQANPIYGTWYDYHGDIFISVICSSKSSYIRRKAISEGRKKTDNEMCFWHSDWQYTKIEGTYGIPKTGSRTYEIIIDYENEKHRIDSLVENIAIEFQHSLGVSVIEMNSRYTAHTANGYTAYLVLDFTDLSYKVLNNIQFNRKGLCISTQAKDTKAIYLKNKIGKWSECKYYKKQNVFLDFKDYMVRLTPRLSHNYLIKKEEFVDSLLSLEEDLKNSIEKAEREEWIEKQEEQELRLQRIEQENRRKKEVYDCLVLQTKQFIKNSSDFKYYRECIQDISFKKYFENIRFDVIDKKLVKCYQSPYYIHHHFYRFYQSAADIPVFILEYNNYFDEHKHEYQFAEIIFRKFLNSEIRYARFIKRRGEKPIKKCVKYELIDGFLHSHEHPAYNEYDEFGRIIRSDYYILNHKIDDMEIFKILGFYYLTGSYEGSDDEIKGRGLVKLINENDKWGIIKSIIQNTYSLDESFWYTDLRREFFDENKIDYFYLDNYNKLKI